MRRPSPLAAGKIALAGACLVGLSLLPERAAAQTVQQAARRFLRPDQCTRIADPKLDGSRVDISYYLSTLHPSYWVTISLHNDTSLIHTIFSGQEFPSTQPILHTWNGRDNEGRFFDPGSYTILVKATAGPVIPVTGWIDTIRYDLSIVRLGITEIEAQPSVDVNEWQMVYFMKGTKYVYYATPAIHEYLSIAEQGEISDLDLDNGEPRPPVPVHTATDSPALESGPGGLSYEDDAYNYPVCYVRGAAPQFEATFGATCTSRAGNAIGCGYPVPGFEIRCCVSEGSGDWASDNAGIVPGGTATFLGPLLPNTVTRTDKELAWSWQYRPTESETDWVPIPGQFTTSHIIYGNYATPFWASGASGTQYTGPWVEVADYFTKWQVALGIIPDTAEAVVECLMKGYFGQNGSLADAIEGVIYDCYPMGGDGGACHYYLYYQHVTQLAKLLNAHANGIYVNCSDVASTSSVMLGMLGIEQVQMVHLGYMSLKAIWGIGCPDYTLDLWGSGSHAFGYHHIVTRDAAVHVSDCCMWVDEDGDPGNLPGTPGYNHDRPWPNYEDLAAWNNVTKYLDPLPEIQ
ncbi:MAG: hypothetical protein AB1486_22470 [Planctomycetota bacterium]